ncbi:MAG: carboxypeptidase regulatory-like domain-containing protein, partial [Sphingomonadales bacterium]|nr:carboxypeptidase regulatory-like domain-containing protein [Sphingomonadales bacterium]
MQLRYFLAASVASLTLATAIATPAFAQETTSAITGQVTDDSGAAVSGAKVTVVHVPSGTRSTATTDGTGNYSLRGLRVGGPYTVTV